MFVNNHLAEKWSQVKPYVVPPVVAGGSIIPALRFFVWKTKLQLGEPVPKMRVTEAFVEGGKVAPLIGVLMGTQLLTQQAVERVLSENKKSLHAVVASAAFAGVVSSPAVAAFQGKTNKRSITESVKALTPKQIAAVAIRESLFIFSVRMIDPVASEAKSRFGNNLLVSLGSGFFSGAVGSLAGHPADTAFSLWQEGKVVKPRYLMRGALMRMIATGIFAMCYGEGKKTFGVN